MAKPERKARGRRRNSSPFYFLGCFGISRKIHSDKIVDDTTTGLETHKKMSRTRWFSRSKNIGKITTTEPIHETEKQDDEKKTMFRVIRHGPYLQDISTVEENTKEKDTSEARDINPDPLSFSGYDTCHKQERSVKLDRAKTMESPRVRKGSRVGRFDPVMGITIVMLTLMIMLIWGRLCAILCASTWFYFLPRLKQVAKRKRGGGDDQPERERQRPSDLELNSEAYKKKVVLDGFLFRQHRVSL